MQDTDIYGEYRVDNERYDYRVVGCVYSLLGVAVILIMALCARTVKASDGFCDIVGSQTPISEGMDIAEHDGYDAWVGVDSAAFEGKPYLILIGPENGYYAIFNAIGGGIAIAPLASLETGDDGYQHDTCGYLITWNP